MRLQNADDLFSVCVAGPGEAQALAAHLRSTGVWLEAVAGIDTVVVRFDAATCDASIAQQRLREALTAEVPSLPDSGELLEIPVAYGGQHGPDLDALCTTLGISEAEFIALHSGSDFRVDMVGFTPGFAFVGGLDASLHVPRRKEPRQRVEAGSIGIADGRTGIYALASPGGWNIVGRTPVKLFDADAEDPFPIRPGMRIRFQAIPGGDGAT